MATADEYAAWIVKNQSLRGTPEFDTVAKAYQEAKSVITTPTTTPTAPARPERTWGQALGDFGVQLGEGANTLVGAIPGLIAPESGATKFFERGAEYWREKQSEPLKQRMAAADVSIQKAGEEGIISQIVEAASQYYDDPALAARFVVTNLPSMIPGLGATKLAQAAALAKGATAAKAAGVATTTGGAVNAILNAGGARAEAFQDIQKTLIEQGYSPAEAEKKAIEDSRLVAAVGGVTGFISGKTGLEKAIAGGVTKGGVRAGAGRVAGELAGEQIEEVAPKFATNVQAAEYDARSLGKDIGRTIVETGIASGPGAALSGVMGGARPEVSPTAPAITPTGGAPTPPAAGPEVQEVRDRLAARGFSEEDIDRILAERAKREAPAAPPTAETPAEAAKEPTDVTAATLPANVPAVTEAQPGVGEPSVGVPSGDLGRPTTAEPAAPVGRGLERPVTPPAPRVETEAPIPTELTETPRGTQAPETIQAKEEGSAQPAAPAPTAVEAPAPAPTRTLKATDLLRGLTRETRIPGMEGERVADPVAQDILKTRGAENLDTELAKLGYTPTGIVGAGAGSVVLDAGDSVVRLGVGEATPVPKVSGVLQPIASGNIGTIRYDVMPKVDTTGVTQKHVEQLTSELEQQGYKFSDAGIDNVGLIKGVPYVIDPGAITKSKPTLTAAPTPTEPKVTFKTALGSSYSAFPDGTTQRVKAERNLPGHEGDKGSKERSVRTVYLDSEASALSAAGVTYPEGAKPRVVLKDGTATLTWIVNGKRGSAKAGTKVPFYTEPAVGRFPLELWQPRKDVPGYEAYAGTHAGNQIVEVSTPATTPPVEEKPARYQQDKEQPPQKTGKYPLPAQAIEDLKDNNLALALEAIETSKPSEINKAIAARLKVLLKNTKVTIADDLRDSKGNPVLGAASTSGSRIWLDANRGMNMETVLHESVHAATERILSTPENQRTPQQNAAVQELTDLWNAAKTNGVINLTPEASDSLSEFVAEGMTNIELQDQLASVKWESRTMWAGFKRILLNMLGIKTPASMLDYTLASVDTIFAAVPKAATPAQPTTKAEPKEEPKVLQKPKLTAEEKAKKEAEEADAKVTEAMRKFAESKTSEEAAKAASTLQSLRSSTTAIPQLRRLYDSVSNLGRRRLVQVLPIDFLVELASKNVPELKTTTNLLGRMSGMREQLLHGASQTSDRISRAFKKDPLLRGRLEEVVYASTLAQIDPSTNKISEKLNTLYKALGEEGQTIYKEVRDYYTDMGDLYSQLIKSNVERSEASEESKAAILAKLKVMFEPANRMRPYFPLMREGNYWFSSGKGKNRRFHMFETMPERDAALEAFARSEGKSLESMKETSEVKFGNNVASLREISKDTDQSLTDVLALVGKLDTGSAASKQELLDSVYQMYLNSLPEQSFRKHYITREGVAGFRTDFLRNFSQSAIQMSGQLARVKYGPQIRASLLGAKASIENQPQYEPYVEEMTKRAERDLVPPARTSLDAISDVLTKWTYIHYLSSVSSALLQPVGILQTALPVLGGRYGYGKTAAEVAKLAKVWDSFSTTRNLPDGTTTTVFPTVANSKAVNASPLEKQAIKEMLARDVSQSTMARELYGYRAKPTDRVNTKLDKGIKGANFLMGGLMHHTERIAREIVFLASYRLNIEAGKSHEAAIDAAVKDTQDSLGNYSQYARPLIMRNPGGKIVLQFSTYPLHIASFLANNFYKMIPILNKEGKAEAAKIFFGTLGTTWILAGAAGFPAPVSAVLMGFISTMFKALGDDDEMPDEMRNQDFTKWFNEIWLPSQLGHIEVFGHKLSDIVKTGVVNVAGWDFASRTGLNNLFLREQKETKTPREGLQAAIIDKAGPSINMMLSYADGVQAFKEGDYQRAVEKVAPAAVRSVAQTYKFVTEGAKDIKGNELITKGDFTTGELIGRSIGFQPSRLANLQKVNAEVKQEEAKMANERSLLLRRLDIADRKKSDLGEKQFQTVLKDINTYNVKYPTNSITPDSLFEFLEGTQEERAKSLQGVTITEKTPVDVVKMIELSRTK